MHYLYPWIGLRSIWTPSVTGEPRFVGSITATIYTGGGQFVISHSVHHVDAAGQD